MHSKDRSKQYASSAVTNFSVSPGNIYGFPPPREWRLSVSFCHSCESRNPVISHKIWSTRTFWEVTVLYGNHFIIQLFLKKCIEINFCQVAVIQKLVRMSVKNHLTNRIEKVKITNYLDIIEKIAQRRAGFSCETKASKPLSGGDAFFVLLPRL